MSDKGRIHHGLKGLQRVKTWQLIVLLILAGFVAATLLRVNNVGMVERRSAVMSADEVGDADVIIQRLYDLQRYVSAHMNTDLDKGVYLEASYNRDLAKWQATQYGDSNPNGNIYKKAQETCAPRFSSWSTAYVQCVSAELAKYPSSNEISSDTSRPRQETYVYSYTSPLWAPDFAGWAVLLCVVIIALILIRLLFILVLHLLLQRKYRSI